MENEKEISVLKPLFSVHMSNDLTLFEKKVMNCLIRHIHNIEASKDKLCKYITPQGNFYEFTFDMIEEWLELEKYHQRRDIILALKKLITTTLEFNILKRDNRKFKDVVMSVLLAGVRFRESFSQEKDSPDENIQNSKIYFALSPFIVETILTPIPYTNIAFREQNKLDSRYSLALWEILSAELDVQGKDSCLTQIFPVEKYEDLIAGKDSKYKEFKYINKELVKKPLKEINKKTNIEANVILHKRGKKTSGLQFDVIKKNNASFLLLQEHLPDKEKRIKVKNELKKFIASDKLVEDIMKAYQNDDYILTNLKSVSASKKTPSPALVRAALKDDYAGFNNGDLFFSNKDYIKVSKQNSKQKVAKEEFSTFIDTFKAALKAELGEAVFDLWFKDLSFLSYENGTAIFCVPDVNVKDGIFKFYNNRFKKILKKSFEKNFEEKVYGFSINVN